MAIRSMRINHKVKYVDHGIMGFRPPRMGAETLMLDACGVRFDLLYSFFLGLRLDHRMGRIHRIFGPLGANRVESVNQQLELDGSGCANCSLGFSQSWWRQR